MTIQGDVRDIFYRIPGHPSFPEELYMGRTYITTMTRKDKMREGYVIPRMEPEKAKKNY